MVVPGNTDYPTNAGISPYQDDPYSDDPFPDDAVAATLSNAIKTEESVSCEQDSTEQPSISAEAVSADVCAPRIDSRAQLLEVTREFESSFRRKYPILWGITLTGPFLFTAFVLTLIGMVWGWALVSKYITAAFITFFILGRFVILAGVEGQTEGWMQSVALAPEQLFCMVTFMDVMVALFVTFHMGILFRLPWAGPKIAGLVCDGTYIMERQPWLKRIASIGLILFVMFPTSTTGSIGGSIFGRLLGLSRFLTIMGVLLGSIIGNGLMYFFAKEINKYIGQDSIWLKVSGILILVVGVALVEWRYRTIKKKNLAANSNNGSENLNG